MNPKSNKLLLVVARFLIEVYLLLKVYKVVVNWTDGKNITIYRKYSFFFDFVVSVQGRHSFLPAEVVTLWRSYLTFADSIFGVRLCSLGNVVVATCR